MAPSPGFMNHKMAMGIDFYGHAHHVRYLTLTIAIHFVQFIFQSTHLCLVLTLSLGFLPSTLGM